MAGSTLIKGIDCLLTMDVDGGTGQLGERRDVSVVMEGGEVAWIGPSENEPSADVLVDGSGCVALPGLVDCHTHTLWAGSRSDEFEQRLAGARYEDILEAGGGILSTVRATRAASEDELVRLGTERLLRMRARGVLTVEIKSGYGLEREAEVRMLRAARRAAEQAGVGVVTTYLGAHTIPAELRHDRAAYVHDIVYNQLPAVVGLADAVDVYVDRGAFTLEEGLQILRAGKALGLSVRAHAEQVTHTGIAAAAAALGATSVDHLERLDEVGVRAIAASGSVAVLLPGAMLYLRDSAPPVAALRAAGVPLAVATDFNPGSSPVDDLWICASLACVTLGLTVSEALLGITRVAALALARPDLGRVRVGDRGGLVLAEPAPGQPATAASLVQFMGAPKLRYLAGARLSAPRTALP